MKRHKITADVCNAIEKHIIFLEKSHTFSKKYLTKNDFDFLDMCILKYKSKVPNKIFTNKETKKLLKRFTLDLLKKKLIYYRSLL